VGGAPLWRARPGCKPGLLPGSSTALRPEVQPGPVVPPGMALVPPAHAPRGSQSGLGWRKEDTMRQTSKCRAVGEGEAPRGGNRNSLYDEVTAKIIAQLEAGHFPWVQPWGKVDGAGQGGCVPRCLIMR
jgi:hypothetical protein